MEQRPGPGTPGWPAHMSAHMPASHDGMATWVQQQQRYWHEWMEAGQLWLSWWVSTLPPLNWPPTGTVLPPAVTPTTTSTATPTSPVRATSGAAEAASVAPKPAPARKPRAAAQRHH